MTTLNGSIASVNSKITATFLLNDIPITYTGTVGVSIPDFQAVAQLTYTADVQITGTQSYNGVLGANTVKLTTGNNVVINGPLTPPIIPAITIVGNGSWSKG
ncbi:hypothetical protein BDW22DRAFT_1359932 [Trametopsis cervina]|nr:hypothetical protein BDW22DRAFT_1359932 [Trametopsis cervina]